MGKGIRMYDPKKSVEYKDIISSLAKEQYAGKPIEYIPLKMDLRFYRMIPKSVSNKRRKLKENGEIRPVVKPDVDNYSKAILDALNGILYKDDSQIVELNVSKYYSDDTRVELEIYKL